MVGDTSGGIGFRPKKESVETLEYVDIRRFVNHPVLYTYRKAILRAGVTLTAISENH